MPAQTSKPKEDYQNIFHWAETQKDGTIPSFRLRKNDPYEVSFSLVVYQETDIDGTDSTKRALGTS